MPQTFVAPSGREYEWQGDSQPTQADIDAIVAYENEIVAREKAEARRAERPRGLSGKPEPVVEPFRPDPAQIRPQVTAGAAAGALAGATGKQPPQLPSFRAAFGSTALKSKAAAKFFDKPQAKAPIPKPPAPSPRQAIDDLLRRAFEERAIVPRQGETQEQFQVRQAIAQKAAVERPTTPQITTLQEQRSRGIQAREVPPEELEQAVFEEMIALPEDELRSLVDERRTIWERNKGNYTAFKDYEQAQAALEEKLGLRRLFDPINALRGLQLQAHKAVVRDDIPATERLVALVNTVEGVVTAASLGSKSVLFDPAIHGLKAAGRVLKPALVKALQSAGKYTSSAKVAVERAVKSMDDKNLAAFRNALERLNLTDDQLKPVVDDVVKHVEDLSAKLDDTTVKQVEGVAPTKVEGEASGAIQVKQAEVSAEEGAGRVRQEAPEAEPLTEPTGERQPWEARRFPVVRNTNERDATNRFSITSKLDETGKWIGVRANELTYWQAKELLKRKGAKGTVWFEGEDAAGRAAELVARIADAPSSVANKYLGRPTTTGARRSYSFTKEAESIIYGDAPMPKDYTRKPKQKTEVSVEHSTKREITPEEQDVLRDRARRATEEEETIAIAKELVERRGGSVGYSQEFIRTSRLEGLDAAKQKLLADYPDLATKYAKETPPKPEPPVGKEPWEMTREGAKVHISNALDEAETYAKTHTPPAPQWDNELKASIKKAQKQYDDARKAWDRNPMPTEFQVKRLREAEAKLKDLKERGGKAQADNRVNDDFFKKKEAEYLLQKYPDMFEARNEWPFYMGSSRYSDLYYHKDTVVKALREGKPVPPEVLADYPDLAAKYAKETPTKPAAVIQETTIPKTSKQSIPETTTTPAKKPPTKIQQALEGAGEERVSAYEAMAAARKRAAAQMKRGGKKTGAAGQPILPEEFAYFKAWAKEKGLQGAAATEQFLIHVKDELGESVAHWKRVLASAPKEVTPKAQPKRSTGLANVVQDQEALEGIIQEVEKGSGKSAKYWAEKGESILSGHESGKAIHAEGDYIALARRIAAEETPATGERIGIILAGKARMLRKVLDVQDTIRKLVDDGADKKLIGAAKRDLEAVETQLADYLTDVQVGKGIWSDVGRAMQGGIDIDYGNYVDVLERFIRSGRKPTEREAKQLSAAVNDYQQYVKKVVPSYDPAKETAEQAIQRHIDEQIQKAKAEYILKEVTGKSKPKSGRSLKEIRKSRETTKAALRSAFRKALKPDIGSGLGSLESLIEQAPEIVRLLKRYIAEWVEERVAIKASAELDDLYKHLRDELPDMLEEGADVTDRDIQRLLAGVYDEVAKPRSEVARQVAELKRQSKLLENIDRVTEGDELLLAKTPAESSKKVKRLRTLYNALRVSMGRVDSPPGARQRVEKVIADLDAQLKGEYRNIKTKRVVTNKDLKDQAQSLRKTMRLKDTIYELEDRLRTGSLQKPPKEVKELTLEQQNLQARADILRNRVRSQLREANRSTGMNVAHAAASLFRGLKLGQDLGQIRRQGLFVSPLSRTFWVAISKAGKSAFSEEAEHRFLREIEERVLPGQRFAAPIRKKAGLSLTTDVVSTEEELSIGRFLSTFKWTRPFARPLERFQRVFINSARADVFDYSVLAGRTDNELLHRARFINNATGRGNVKRVPELLQIVMTSPNYEFSRWGMIGEIPRNPARFLSDLAHGRGVNMGVVDNMRQMATTVGELLGIAGIASMAGYRINLDGDSSDFLKLRKYDDKGKPTDEVWDLTAGIGVRLRDIFRTGKAFGGAEYNKAFDSLIGKTAVRTISPGVRGPVELASVMGQRLKGEEKPTSFFTSFESEETGWSLITPLIWQQAYEAYQRGEPPSRQAFLDALEQYSKELVGTGPQYYKPPQSASTIRIPKELQ